MRTLFTGKRIWEEAAGPTHTGAIDAIVKGTNEGVEHIKENQYLGARLQDGFIFAYNPEWNKNPDLMPTVIIGQRQPEDARILRALEERAKSGFTQRQSEVAAQLLRNSIAVNTMVYWYDCEESKLVPRELKRQMERAVLFYDSIDSLPAYNRKLARALTNRQRGFDPDVSLSWPHVRNILNEPLVRKEQAPTYRRVK